MTLFQAKAATNPKPLVTKVTICFKISLWSFLSDCFSFDGCIFGAMRVLYGIRRSKRKAQNYNVKCKSFIHFYVLSCRFEF